MFRTKVECAGQCLLTSLCSAFSFIGTNCETFNAEYLYRNKNDYNPREVYIEDSLWNMHGNESIILISQKKKIIYEIT